MREAKVDRVGIFEILQANSVECHENVSHSRDPSVACTAAYTGSVQSCDGYPRCRTRVQNRSISDEKRVGRINGRVYG